MVQVHPIALGVLGGVLVADAWLNTAAKQRRLLLSLAARIEGTPPNHSSKPTPLRGAA